MATLMNQGTLYYTQRCREQQSLTSNTTATEVEVSYGLRVFHGVTPDTFTVGDTVSYTVVLENTETGTLFTPNVTVGVTGGTLSLVADSVRGYLLTPSGIGAVVVEVTSTDPLSFFVDTAIPAGGFLFIDYDAVVTAAVGEEIVSLAVGAANGGSPTGPILTDRDTAVTRRVAVTLQKTAPETASVGESIAYRFTVTNEDTTPITLDRLTDDLPEGFAFTGVTLTVGGVNVPLVAGVDYTVSTDGTFVLLPSETVSLPGGMTAVLTLTGVVTA